MSKIEYHCNACDTWFERVVLRGAERTVPDCPSCRSRRVQIAPSSRSLFNGIANFSTLARDTH